MMFPPRGQTDGGEEEVEKRVACATAEQTGVLLQGGPGVGADLLGRRLAYVNPNLNMIKTVF